MSALRRVLVGIVGRDTDTQPQLLHVLKADVVAAWLREEKVRACMGKAATPRTKRVETMLMAEAARTILVQVPVTLRCPKRHVSSFVAETDPRRRCIMQATGSANSTGRSKRSADAYYCLFLLVLPQERYR
mmetsp:Transcript_28004/g.61004  ORF Transcript_28004/g.61004 Transcript_28004/m.61004 type:complete len:131 (+) Transcript_28004:966-1358(+)